MIHKLSIITLVTCYVLILAGSIVRTTGSGLGCPDWPKCFGKIIPPTSTSELPQNYKTKFSIQGKKIADFNVFKTWIEYINRLIGVITGIEMFILLCLCFKQKKFQLVSLTIFTLTAIQGGIGAKVVSSHLMPQIITLHVIIALIILFFLHYLVYISSNASKTPIKMSKSRSFKKIVLTLLALGCSQFVLGTDVRKSIDIITNTTPFLPRSLWLNDIGLSFYIHRSFSIVILCLSIFLIRYVYKYSIHEAKAISLKILFFVIVQIITGILFSYFSMPKFAQPIHLLFSSLFLGFTYLLFLKIKKNG